MLINLKGKKVENCFVFFCFFEFFFSSYIVSGMRCTDLSSNHESSDISLMDEKRWKDLFFIFIFLLGFQQACDGVAGDACVTERKHVGDTSSGT